MTDVKVHHDITGPSDLPVLVLAGPLGSTMQIWQPQVEALADITESIRELAYYRRTVFVPAPGPTSEEAQAAAQALINQMPGQ